MQPRSREVEIRSIRLCLSTTDRREHQAKWNGEVVGRRRDEEAGGGPEKEEESARGRHTSKPPARGKCDVP